ncbi:MAG: DUF2520 domain-containing protein [Actinomycetaceae bacterium]|nr:DUF2520 domain-containing protein [Actinomycetaceae bacterium]
MMKTGRLGVGIVGCGKVGGVLGSALRSVGHSVVGVSAGSAQSKERAAAMLPGVPVVSVEEVVERCELVFLTVPDRELPGLVQGLATLGAWQPGQLVIHTCGAHGVDILEPASARGALPLAIHPAMTFTGTSIDVARLAGCPFAVTAAPVLQPIAQALVVEMGGEPVLVEEQARPLYHAALAHGANHLLTVVTQAMRALKASGVEDPSTFAQPLLQAALDRALQEGEDGLSGPVIRGDASTVAAHVKVLAQAARAADMDEAALGNDGEALNKLANPRLHDVAQTYRFLAETTAQRANERGALNDLLTRNILDALGPEK